MIVRIAHREHFTIIRNKTLRDSRLSFKARGLLAYLLSLPDDAVIDRDHLSRVGPDGQHAIRTALVELDTAGYLKREKRQLPDGTWRTESTLYEAPQRRRTGGGKSATGGGKSDVGKPTSKGPLLKDQGGGPLYNERAAAPPAGSLEAMLQKIGKRIPDA